MPAIAALLALALAASPSRLALPVQATVTTETLAADTPRTTVAGNKFIAPAGWTLEVKGPATILTPPRAAPTSSSST